MHTTPEFALGRTDYRRLQKVAARRLSPRGRAGALAMLSKVVVWMVLSTTIFFFLKMVDRLPQEATALEVLATLLVLAVLLVAWSPAIAATLTRQGQLAENGSFLRTHRLEFTDAAMSTRWATGFAEMQVAGFIGKDADDRNFYLFVDNCAAYVVPRAVVAEFQAEFDRWMVRIPAA